MVNVPEIQTEHLKLRGHRVDDFAESVALWADPIVTRYIGGKPFTREEVWTRLLRYVGHWQCMGFGYWVIEEKASGAFAGEMGFADYRRDIDPSLEGIPEAGWVLAPRLHGKGYATEGVRAIHAWAEKRFDRAPTACLIHPENAPSLRVAEKCGYREMTRTTYHGQPTIIFSR